MPWTISRVSLSTSTLILLPRRPDNLLGRVLHSFSNNKIQPRFAKNFLALLDVRTLETDHDRNFYADSLRRFDNTGSDHIAAHDSTENINKDGLHIFV